MNRFLLHSIVLLLILPSLYAQGSLNVELVGQINRGDVRYSGCWSYVAADGSEYALIGAQTGTAIYNIDDPDAYDELAFIPGPVTRWREITTLEDYAYVITDVQGENHGMQVIDLSGLPEEATLVTTYTATFTKGHIIQRDLYSNDPYVYVMGDGGPTRGVHIMDVSNPSQPFEIGYYNPDYYIHDCFVKGDRMYASAFNEGTIDVVDISNKSNPTLIKRIVDENGATHSCFLTEDDTHLVVCNEMDGLPSNVYDITDLENVEVEAAYSANKESLVHNPYIKDDLIFYSHNTEGLRIVDIANPKVPVEVGYFDTFDGPSGGFNGLWSACPFFPSGKVIGGDRTGGLYVWTFTSVTPGRFFGSVRDSMTNAPIFNATVVILEKSDTLKTDLTGGFKAGALPGFYTLFAFADGYKSKSKNVVLNGGDSINVEIKLVPFTSSDEEITVERTFKHYPNPITDFSIFQFPDFTDAALLAIYSSDGRKLLQQNVSGIQQWRFDRPSDWPSGWYHCQLLDAKGKILDSGELILR